LNHPDFITTPGLFVCMFILHELEEWCETLDWLVYSRTHLAAWCNACRSVLNSCAAHLAILARRYRRRGFYSSAHTNGRSTTSSTLNVSHRPGAAAAAIRRITAWRAVGWQLIASSPTPARCHHTPRLRHRRRVRTSSGEACHWTWWVVPGASMVDSGAAAPQFGLGRVGDHGLCSRATSDQGCTLFAPHDSRTISSTGSTIDAAWGDRISRWESKN